MTKKITLVNSDGWIGTLEGDAGRESKLCPGRRMLNVRVTGYTDWLENESKFVEDIKKRYPIGKLVTCNEKNFKPYPEYKYFKCGEWVK